jgi:hypothetical protein
MTTPRAPHQLTERLLLALSTGPEAVVDVTLPYIDLDAVPELLELVDDRIAGLRTLRHKLVTHAAGVENMIACARCQTRFLPRGRGQRYCSGACRQAGYRNGRKA